MNQRRSVSDTPEQWLSGAERDDVLITEWVGCRDNPGFLDECHGIRVVRKTVEVSTKETGEAFESIESVDTIKGLNIEREGSMSGVAARAAARCFLCVLRMGRRVRTEEKLRITGSGSAEERLAMFFPLEHRQTVVVWTKASLENGIPVVEEVMRCDCRSDIGAGLFHELDGFTRGDVFQHDVEIGELFEQPFEGLLEKNRFPIKDVDIPLVIPEGFAMKGENQTVLLHSRKNRLEPFDIGHAVGGIGGGIRWIKLGCQDAMVTCCQVDIRHRSAVSEINGHERPKSAGDASLVTKSRKNSAAVTVSFGCG